LLGAFDTIPYGFLLHIYAVITSYFIIPITEKGNFFLASLFDGGYIKLHWPETARMGMFVYPM
jgi:hypothetical protein